MIGARCHIWWRFSGRRCFSTLGKNGRTRWGGSFSWWPSWSITRALQAPPPCDIAGPTLRRLNSHKCVFQSFDASADEDVSTDPSSGSGLKNFLFLWIDFRFIITGKTTTLLRVVSNHTTVCVLLLHGCSGVQLSATCFQVGRPHALYRCTRSSSFSASVTAHCVRHSCHVAALSFFGGVLVFLLADTLTHILSFLS